MIACVVALMLAVPAMAFADEATADSEAAAENGMTAQAAPYKNKYASYWDAVSAFVSDSRFAPGTPWDDYDSPKLDTSLSGYGGCAAYVVDFGLFVFGSDCFEWSEFQNPSDIQAGDCVRLTLPSGAEHSFAVLSRNGSTLETIEGNYNSSVERKTDRYSVRGNTLYEYGRECTVEWINRAPDIYSYNLADAQVDPLAQSYMDDPVTGEYTNNYLYFDAHDTYEGDIYFGGQLLSQGVDYRTSFKLAAGDAAYHRTGVLRLTGMNNFKGSSAVFRFEIPNQWNSEYQAVFDENEKHGTVARLAGNNALDTMKKIVETGKFKAGGTVVLASVEGYWDALTAAGIAGLENAPVVMTTGKALSDQAKSLLQSLKPAKIVVCGGTGTISDAVAKAAKSAAGATTLTRAAGSTATGTAVDIFAKGEGWSNTAIVATVGTYHDALAAAPLAYANKMPIFLADYNWSSGKGTLSAATLDAMKKGGINKVYIAGGAYWISTDVESQLKGIGISNVKRLAGATAVETSTAIAGEAVGTYGMKTDKLGVATTDTYYDALAGAAFCGKNKSVLLLVSGPRSSSIESYVWGNSYPKTANAYVFGGTGSVTPDTYAALAEAVY